MPAAESAVVVGPLFFFLSFFFFLYLKVLRCAAGMGNRQAHDARARRLHRPRVFVEHVYVEDLPGTVIVVQQADIRFQLDF